MDCGRSNIHIISTNVERLFVDRVDELTVDRYLQSTENNVKETKA